MSFDGDKLEQTVKPSDDYPQLDTLIGGWFHEDFDLDGNTLESIVAAYKKVYSLRDWQRTRDDIQSFLQERDDSQVKEDFVQLFHPGVDPESWGTSTRQWLLNIAELLQ